VRKVALVLSGSPLTSALGQASHFLATGSHTAKLILGFVTIGGLILGFYAQQMEARETDRLKSIMTDEGIQYLLYRYEYYIFEEDEFGQRVFSLSTLAGAIAQHTRITDRSMCETTASAIVQKLLARGLISSKETKSLSPKYAIDQEVIQNLDHGVPWDFDHQSYFQKARNRIRRALTSRSKEKKS
jgi:hypothetical protein